MASRVIHFGVDECHRLMVLRNAGFAVEECGSLHELRAALLAETPAEAVCVSAAEAGSQGAVISLARARCSGPLVLFQGLHRDDVDPAFDLVVANLTPPEVWLAQIRMVIARSKRVCERPPLLVGQAEHPRREPPERRGDAGAA